MRNLFMSPRNLLRVEEAMLALLAGDIFVGWSIRARASICLEPFITSSSSANYGIASAQSAGPLPKVSTVAIQASRSDDTTETHLVLIPSYNTGGKLLDTVAHARRKWQPVWVW